MCSGFICGIVTTAVGAALVVASTLVGFYFVPDIIENLILDEVVLLNDTIQMERFQEIPFPIEFKVRIFNVSNADHVLQGAVPHLTELGPYVYKVYQQRLIERIEEDRIWYRVLLNKEFDSEASYPYTEDDIVHVTNVAYHGVLQMTESILPDLVGLLNMALGGIFGDKTGPILKTRVGDFMFDGIDLCQNPGLAGSFACAIIRNMAVDIQNMDVQPDNTIKFSIFGYRNGRPGPLHEVYRGINNHENLARITSLDGNPYLPFWSGPIDSDDNSTEPRDPTVCSMINGTDSGIFAPFVDKTRPIYALNTDICRSVELRFQHEVEVKDIPAYRFSSNEWFLDNDDGCFCLNVTKGIRRQDGCLLRGAQEMFSCIGAYMVLTYPHFLYADFRYRNGVLGLNPVEEDHRIYLDLEPNTGTVVRGAKRAQFNVFMRAIDGIPETQHLRTTLVPFLWIEEGITLIDEYAELISNDVVRPLSLVNILVPVAVALSCAVLLMGITIILCTRAKKTTV